MPYGNALHYQLGDPGRFKISKRFRHRFRHFGAGLSRAARMGVALVPGPVGLVGGAALNMGDPGFGGFFRGIFGVARAAARGVTKAVSSGVSKFKQIQQSPLGQRVGTALGGAITGMEVGGPVGAAVGGLTGGALGGGGPTLEDAAAQTGLSTSHPLTRRVHKLMGGRHRRINPANVHALRRANRRLTGFVKLYRRTARHLGYTVHRGSAARAKGRFGRKH